LSDINTIAVFIEYRISMIYLMAFIYAFSEKRYSRYKTISLMSLCFFIIAGIEYIYFFVCGNSTNNIPITILETILVQGTCLLIQEKRSFKGLFIGITAAAYVLLGNVGWSMAYIYSDNWIFIFAIQIITHTLLLGIMIVGIRDMFLRQLVYVEKGWKMLCLVPALFYVLTYALTEWPINIYEHPQAIAAVLVEMLLLVLEYIFFVRLLSAREKMDEMKLNQEYLDVYAKRIEQEQDRMLKKEEEVAIIRHDLRHYTKLAYAYLTEGNVEKIKELLEQTDHRLEETRPERYCQNMSVNVVVSYCMMLAQKKNVSLELDLQIPAKLRWNEYEYATVISNLLEKQIKVNMARMH